MILYLVRHGDPIYDPDSLTPLGEAQANALAKRFALYGLDEIYASTSNRAQLTAKPTCASITRSPALAPIPAARSWKSLTVCMKSRFSSASR